MGRGLRDAKGPGVGAVCLVGTPPLSLCVSAAPELSRHCRGCWHSLTRALGWGEGRAWQVSAGPPFPGLCLCHLGLLLGDTPPPPPQACLSEPREN